MSIKSVVQLSSFDHFWHHIGVTDTNIECVKQIIKRWLILSAHYESEFVIVDHHLLSNYLHVSKYHPLTTHELGIERLERFSKSVHRSRKLPLHSRSTPSLSV